jgi:LPXTG-motif cell wall-anchored protein
VAVTSVNDAPVAIDDSETTLPDTPVTIDVLVNDSDADGDVLTVVSTTQPANGTVAINPDGTITYTPDAGFTGVDTFSYAVADGNGSTTSATVTVTVSTENNPPVFTDDPTNTSQTVTVGGSTTRLTAVDPDGDLYSFILSAGTLPPGVNLNPDGTFSGSPTSLGTFSATITVCDTNALCTTSVLTIQVVAPGALPHTGVNSGSLAVVGMLLLLLGGLLVTASRRRREPGI